MSYNTHVQSIQINIILSNLISSFKSTFIKFDRFIHRMWHKCIWNFLAWFDHFYYYEKWALTYCGADPTMESNTFWVISIRFFLFSSMLSPESNLEMRRNISHIIYIVIIFYFFPWLVHTSKNGIIPSTLIVIFLFLYLLIYMYIYEHLTRICSIYATMAIQEGIQFTRIIDQCF